MYLTSLNPFNNSWYSASYEADRIFVLILQKSSKWPFYPLSALHRIAYCFRNNIMDMGLKKPGSDL